MLKGKKISRAEALAITKGIADRVDTERRAWAEKEAIPFIDDAGEKLAIEVKKFLNGFNSRVDLERAIVEYDKGR